MFNKYGTEPGKAAPGNSETTPKEKAAGMLQTPATASKEQCNAIVSTAEKTGKQARKEYATIQAQFARLGHVLNRIHRADDGQITYVVSRGGQQRHYSELHDVVAYLAALMEVRP